MTFSKLEHLKYKEFEGTVYRGQPDTGKMTYKNGGHYEGKFSDNKPVGYWQAHLIYPEDHSEYKEFEGTVYRGQPDTGKMTYKTGGHYEGEFSNNKPVGYGQAHLIYPEDSEYAKFEGTVYQGQPSEGKMTYKDGRKVQFESGKPK